jgi:hypothetical protein
VLFRLNRAECQMMALFRLNRAECQMMALFRQIHTTVVVSFFSDKCTSNFRATLHASYALVASFQFPLA